MDRAEQGPGSGGHVATTATPLMVHHPRQSLRFTPGDHPRVEVRRGVDPWGALPDVVAITRALTRQLALDAPATRRWVDEVARSCNRDVDPGDSVVDPT